MSIDRRKFLGLIGAAGLGGTLLGKKANAAALKHFEGYKDSYGVLFDSERCIGCRKCEAACNEVNNLPEPENPFDDLSVLEKDRRPDAEAYTVVNKYQPKSRSKPVYRKIQCNHCLEPACASACFVAAYKKTQTGAVVYDPSVCVGCRYCMIACPFQIPAYTYSQAYLPHIMKCNFCYPRLKEGKLPGCVQACPKEALTFGQRDQLIEIARQRIKSFPDTYVDHIYGEHEMGGTSWLYISGIDFSQMDMREDLGTTPAPMFTSGALEVVPMITALWPVLLGGIYAINKRRNKITRQEREEAVNRALEEANQKAEARIKEFKEKAEQEKKDAVHKAVKEALEQAQSSQDKEES